MANDELEDALEDTVQAITESCIIRIAEHDLTVDVLDGAKETWRTRYRGPYDKALKDGRTWKGDRVRVLERARQVGYLAAFVAGMRAIFEELVRARVIGCNQPPAPGQDVFLQAAAMAVVDSAIADAAGARIDCDMSSQKIPQWIWCPPPTKASREMLMAVLPRNLECDPIDFLSQMLPGLRAERKPT